MNRVVSLLTTCALLVAGTRAASTQELQRIPGTALSLAPPSGFSTATGFSGFLAPDGSSIAVTVLDAPFAELSSGLTDEEYAKRGMEILDRQRRRMGGLDGVLLRAQQVQQGIRFEKVMWIFGGESLSVMIVGTCPNESGDTALSNVRRAILDARWDAAFVPDPLDGVPFRIDNMGGLRLLTVTGGMLTYSLNGQVDPSGDNPVFVCGQATGPFTGELQSFARQRLHRTAHHKSFEILALAPIEIDGLSGFELTATATDRDSGHPKSIYQVTLADGASYWIMQGIVHADQAQPHLPTFKRMARSLRRLHDTLRSDDGSLQLEVPASWTTRSGLDDSASIQAANLIADASVLVFSTSRAHLPDADLEAFLEATVTEFGGTSPASERIAVNGLRGRVFTLTVEDVGEEAAYLFVVLEGSTRFHVLALSTLPERFDDTRAQFDRIVHSFREVDAD